VTLLYARGAGGGRKFARHLSNIAVVSLSAAMVSSNSRMRCCTDTDRRAASGLSATISA
jgi:hypothetical protein